MSSEKGFTSFGKFYAMGEPDIPYLAYLRMLFNEIRQAKTEKPLKGYLIEQDSFRITCFTCNRTSYNKNDIENRYCGYCNKFHN